MAKSEQSILDDVARRVRDVLKDLDQMLNPQKPQRAPVPIPVPVRQPQSPRRGPYR